MCYSKEVQLITATIIIFTSLFFYFFYAKKYSNSSKKWLKPFLNNIILVFLFIGFHQFFEFLSLVTGNEIIYKTGLVISISSMYFMLKSLEILTNKNIHSKLALLFILITSIHIFASKLYFESFNFYLRHYSTFIWASVWIFLFIYWHVCVFTSWKNLKNYQSRKTISLYILFVADISFLLSALYVVIGYWFFSVNVCYDAPSIWCTFFVVQTFFIPFFLKILPTMFDRPIKETVNSIKETLLYFLISLLILILMILILPFFRCLSWKFVFP